MNSREQGIFMKGIEIGMKMCKEFEETEKEKIVMSSGKVKLNLVKQVGRKKWTDEEINILKENKNLSRGKLHKLIPGHNVNSIGAMKYNLFGKTEKEKEDKTKYEGLAKLNQVLIS